MPDDPSDLCASESIPAFEGVSAAARDLGVALAVLSTRLGGLKRRVGARLIRRTTRGLPAMEEGDARRVQAERALDELATAAKRLGTSEAQARTAGLSIRVATRPMARVGRAGEKGETRGLMKAVVEAATSRLLGAAVLGVGGDEAVHGLLYAMQAGASAETIRRTTLIHPTVAELFPTLMGDLRAG